MEDVEEQRRQFLLPVELQARRPQPAPARAVADGAEVLPVLVQPEPLVVAGKPNLPASQPPTTPPIAAMA